MAGVRRDPFGHDHRLQLRRPRSRTTCRTVTSLAAARKERAGAECRVRAEALCGTARSEWQDPAARRSRPDAGPTAGIAGIDRDAGAERNAVDGYLFFDDVTPGTRDALFDLV